MVFADRSVIRAELVVVWLVAKGANRLELGVDMVRNSRAKFDTNDTNDSLIEGEHCGETVVAETVVAGIRYQRVIKESEYFSKQTE